MAKNDLEMLLQRILSGAGRSLGEEVNGLLEPATAGSLAQTDGLLSLLAGLRTLQPGQSAAVAANTQAVLQSTVANATSGGSSMLASVGKAVWSKLGAGLTLSPLILGLVRLFGGGTPESPPALVEYSRPQAIQFEGAVARSAGPQLYALGYDQYGRPRALREEAGAEDARSGDSRLGSLGYDQYGWPRTTSEGAVREDAGRMDYNQQPAPQITIQVQAMDSRSFQDHSAEIAQAVREAMLNSHALNDVVNEL